VATVGLCMGKTNPGQMDSCDVTFTGDWPAPPVVAPMAGRTADEGQTVAFSGSFTDANAADTHTYHWVFGDGETADGSLAATHVYRDDGTYTATLTVTDSTGLKGSGSLTVQVANVAPTVDAGPDMSVAPHEAAQFHGSFTDPGTLDTHEIQWSFG